MDEVKTTVGSGSLVGGNIDELIKGTIPSSLAELDSMRTATNIETIINRYYVLVVLYRVSQSGVHGS
jgi:hypothetical protein